MSCSYKIGNNIAATKEELFDYAAIKDATDALASKIKNVIPGPYLQGMGAFRHANIHLVQSVYEQLNDPATYLSTIDMMLDGNDSLAQEILNFYDLRTSKFMTTEEIEQFVESYYHSLLGLDSATLNNKTSFLTHPLVNTPTNAKLISFLQSINPAFEISIVEKMNAQEAVDLRKSIIYLTQSGISDIAEATAHVFVGLMNDNDPLLQEMIDRIIDEPMYQETVKQYENNPQYQTDGKPNYAKIKKEIVGKLIAAYINKGESQLRKKEFKSLIHKFLNFLAKLFMLNVEMYQESVFKNDPFARSAMRIFEGDTSSVNTAKKINPEDSIYYNLGPSVTINNGAHSPGFEETMEAVGAILSSGQGRQAWDILQDMRRNPFWKDMEQYIAANNLEQDKQALYEFSQLMNSLGRKISNSVKDGDLLQKMDESITIESLGRRIAFIRAELNNVPILISKIKTGLLNNAEIPMENKIGMIQNLIEVVQNYKNLSETLVIQIAEISQKNPAAQPHVEKLIKSISKTTSIQNDSFTYVISMLSGERADMLAQYSFEIFNSASRETQERLTKAIDENIAADQKQGAATPSKNTRRVIERKDSVIWTLEEFKAVFRGEFRKTTPGGIESSRKLSAIQDTSQSDRIVAGLDSVTSVYDPVIQTVFKIILEAKESGTVEGQQAVNKLLAAIAPLEAKAEGKNSLDKSKPLVREGVVQVYNPSTGQKEDVKRLEFRTDTLRSDAQVKKEKIDASVRELRREKRKLEDDGGVKNAKEITEINDKLNKLYEFKKIMYYREYKDEYYAEMEQEQNPKIKELRSRVYSLREELMDIEEDVDSFYKTANNQDIVLERNNRIAEITMEIAAIDLEIAKQQNTKVINSTAKFFESDEAGTLRKMEIHKKSWVAAMKATENGQNMPVDEIERLYAAKFLIPVPDKAATDLLDEYNKALDMARGTFATKGMFAQKYKDILDEYNQTKRALKALTGKNVSFRMISSMDDSHPAKKLINKLDALETLKKLHSDFGRVSDKFVKQNSTAKEITKDKFALFGLILGELLEISPDTKLLQINARKGENYFTKESIDSFNNGTGTLIPVSTTSKVTLDGTTYNINLASAIHNSLLLSNATNTAGIGNMLTSMFSYEMYKDIQPDAIRPEDISESALLEAQLKSNIETITKQKNDLLSKVVTGEYQNFIRSYVIDHLQIIYDAWLSQENNDPTTGTISAAEAIYLNPMEKAALEIARKDKGSGLYSGMENINEKFLNDLVIGIIKKNAVKAIKYMQAEGSRADVAVFEYLDNMFNNTHEYKSEFTSPLQPGYDEQVFTPAGYVLKSHFSEMKVSQEAADPNNIKFENVPYHMRKKKVKEEYKTEASKKDNRNRTLPRSKSDLPNLSPAQFKALTGEEDMNQFQDTDYEKLSAGQKALVDRLVKESISLQEDLRQEDKFGTFVPTAHLTAGEDLLNVRSELIPLYEKIKDARKNKDSQIGITTPQTYDMVTGQESKTEGRIATPFNSRLDVELQTKDAIVAMATFADQKAKYNQKKEVQPLVNAFDNTIKEIANRTGGTVSGIRSGIISDINKIDLQGKRDPKGIDKSPAVRIALNVLGRLNGLKLMFNFVSSAINMTSGYLQVMTQLAGERSGTLIPKATTLGGVIQGKMAADINKRGIRSLETELAHMFQFFSESRRASERAADANIIKKIGIGKTLSADRTVSEDLPQIHLGATVVLSQKLIEVKDSNGKAVAYPAGVSSVWDLYEIVGSTVVVKKLFADATQQSQLEKAYNPVNGTETKKIRNQVRESSRRAIGNYAEETKGLWVKNNILVRAMMSFKGYFMSGLTSRFADNTVSVFDGYSDTGHYKRSLKVLRDVLTTPSRMGLIFKHSMTTNQKYKVGITIITLLALTALQNLVFDYDDDDDPKKKAKKLAQKNQAELFLLALTMRAYGEYGTFIPLPFAGLGYNEFVRAIEPGGISFSTLKKVAYSPGNIGETYKKGEKGVWFKEKGDSKFIADMLSVFGINGTMDLFDMNNDGQYTYFENVIRSVERNEKRR